MNSSVSLNQELFNSFYPQNSNNIFNYFMNNSSNNHNIHANGNDDATLSTTAQSILNAIVHIDDITLPSYNNNYQSNQETDNNDSDSDN